MKNKEIIKIEETDWYKSIVDDCRAILTERVWNSRSELIIGYGEVGERIFTDKNYQKYGKGNRAFNNRLFRDIGIGERNGYYCLEFYEKFIYKKFGDVCTAVQSLPVKEGKNISWNKIKILYLPKPREQKEIPLPKGKYEIIYSDPAWKYPSEQHAKAGEPTTGGSETHYKQVMSDEKLCQLKIQDIAADNCLLFMWTTGPKMESAIEVGKSWGFEYSTVGFVWYKELPNPGTYTMSECEYCLIFRKGNIPQPRGDRNIRQFLSERRTEHSKKPAEIRKRIELMFPKQKKVELFAQGKAPNGWVF